ncbi:mitochondrial inner membrane protein OXA1L isoform X1 [Hydra vulgaris]|nr:mitochondrial inner membrane protein OXA1L [Hydra vulgaris]
MAAGFFFSRAYGRCSSRSSSFIKQSRLLNACKSSGNKTLSRKQHTSTRRPQCSSLFLGTRSTVLLQQNQYLPFFSSTSILSNIQACGLHATACTGEAGIEEGGSSSGIADAEPGNSESSIEPQAVNEILNDVGSMNTFVTGVDVPITTLEGLGGYTPVGFVHNIFDFIHLSVGLPWWGTIIATTVAFRALVFPLMIKGQANTARLAAVKPELEKLQEKLREAANYHNPNIRAQASIELQDFFKKHNCNPLKSIISPLVQLPLFISFFIAIRKMCNLPVESLQTGGILWFSDLSAADPYMIFPIACAFTMLLTIEFGAEASVSNSQMVVMKNVFRGMSVLMVPLTYNFPVAIFLYWMTSNVLSLVQVMVLKVPGVMTFFNIPKVVPVKMDPNIQTGTFMENLKAGFKNAKEAATIKEAEKRRAREAQAALNRTREVYEFNPLLKNNSKLFEEAKNHRRTK